VKNNWKKVLCNGSNPPILGRTENNLETNFNLKENVCIIVFRGLEILTDTSKKQKPQELEVTLEVF
jgi:hypothetical protein